MPGLRRLLAAVIIGLPIGAAPAGAIPIQDAELLRLGGAADLDTREYGSVTGVGAAPALSLPPPLGSSRGTTVAGDHCARQPGWLVRGGTGILSCGAIADILAPTVMERYNADDDTAVHGSLLALLILGLAVLAFAARRPIWIARLMR